MSLSELIAELQRWLDQHGDLPTDTVEVGTYTATINGDPKVYLTVYT